MVRNTETTSTALAYQAVFSKFDYDYKALIAELGDKWRDESWCNDACPCAIAEGDFLGVQIWFDYENLDLCEFPDERKEGAMHKFALTVCGDVHTIHSTDDWAEMKAIVLDGYLARFISGNPKIMQDARDYCSESPIQGVTKYLEPRHSGIQEIVEFGEMDPKNAATPVAVYRDGDDYFWGYYMPDGVTVNAIEGNVETSFPTVEAFKEYAIQAINDERPIPVVADEDKRLKFARLALAVGVVARSLSNLSSLLEDDELNVYLAEIQARKNLLTMSCDEMAAEWHSASWEIEAKAKS